MARFGEAALRVRKRVGAAVVDGFFNGAARIAKLHPRANPASHGVEHIVDVRYLEGTKGKEHLLDVWRPLSGGPPTLTDRVLHSRRRLSHPLEDTHWVMGLGFARRGYLVFNVPAIGSPRAPISGGARDVCAAAAWMAANAENTAATRRASSSRRRVGGREPRHEPRRRARVRARPGHMRRRRFATGIVPTAAVPAMRRVPGLGSAAPQATKAKMSAFIADRLRGRDLVPRQEPRDDLDFADPLVFFERGEAGASAAAVLLARRHSDPLLPTRGGSANAQEARGRGRHPVLPPASSTRFPRVRDAGRTPASARFSRPARQPVTLQDRPPGPSCPEGGSARRSARRSRSRRHGRTPCDRGRCRRPLRRASSRGCTTPGRRVDAHCAVRTVPPPVICVDAHAPEHRSPAALPATLPRCAPKRRPARSNRPHHRQDRRARALVEGRSSACGAHTPSQARSGAKGPCSPPTRRRLAKRHVGLGRKRKGRETART